MVKLHWGLKNLRTTEKSLLNVLSAQCSNQNKDVFKITLVIKQMFYLQKVEAPKITLGILFWITKWTFCASMSKEITVQFSFICIFRKYMFCVQLYGKWTRWGHYNLYFEALKGLFLKNAP